ATKAAIGVNSPASGSRRASWSSVSAARSRGASAGARPRPARYRRRRRTRARTRSADLARARRRRRRRAPRARAPRDEGLCDTLTSPPLLEANVAEFELDDGSLTGRGRHQTLGPHTATHDQIARRVFI